jgi:hypothetical protein
MMKNRPTAKQLASMRHAFAPLTVATAIPLECPPLHVVGQPPTERPMSPNEPVPMISRKPEVTSKPAPKTSPVRPSRKAA